MPIAANGVEVPDAMIVVVPARVTAPPRGRGESIEGGGTDRLIAGVVLAVSSSDEVSDRGVLVAVSACGEVVAVSKVSDGAVVAAVVVADVSPLSETEGVDEAVDVAVSPISSPMERFSESEGFESVCGAVIESDSSP